MAQLNDFSKIIHNGNEIGKVLHQGKTIWQGVYLAQDSDFVELYGYWIYKGAELEVEIPTHINGNLVTSTYAMFSGDSAFQATPVTKVVLNHSNVTDMDYMFYNSSATTLDLSNFNTSSVTNMRYMFNNSSATTLDLANFNTSNVTDMSNMFQYSSATTLDLSSFNTSNVTDMRNMFYNSSATTGYARTQADANRFNASSNKPTGLNFVVKPSDVYLAQDSDFVKVDGFWVYRGSELEIKIPHVIQGESITSCQAMFDGDSPKNATPVTRVVSDNPNVTDMVGMFYGSKATTLDLSSFDTSKVINTFYMFADSAATVGYARTQADADKFNATEYKPAGLTFVVK